MRKSLAPSSQSAKRFKFMSPITQRDFHLDAENDFCSSIPSPKCSISSKEPSETKIIQTPEKSDLCLHSTDDVLKLITETTPSINDSISVNGENSQILTERENKSKEVLCVEKTRSEESKKPLDNLSSSNDNSKFHYNVLWCKRSAKKHKIWEGDGILIVSNRSAVLKNSEGKVIERGIGYKLKEIESLEEGSKFNIGGKECEIQSVISADEVMFEEKDEPEIKTPVFAKKKKPCM